MAVVTTQQSVAALYTAIFNRAPDQAGLNFWTAQINGGASFATIAEGFAQHEVFTTGIGALPNADYVNALYTNILGSAGDAAGIAYWTARLAAGESKASVVASFVEGSLTIDLPALLAAGSLTQADYDLALVRQQTLTNKADVGIYFANTLGAASNLNPATVSTSKAGLEADPIYKASQAAIAGVDSTGASVKTAQDAIAVAAGSPNPAQALLGQTFTLTAGADSFVGGAANDTFTAGEIGVAAGLTASLTALDKLDGGAGKDTLNVTATVAPLNTTALGLSIKNIEVANFQGTQALTVDSSAWTGLTDLNVTKSVADVSLTAAATTAVTVTQADAKVTVIGGATQTINLTKAGDSIALSKAAGAVNLTVADQNGKSVTIDDGTSVTVTNTVKDADGGTIVVGNTTKPTGDVTITQNLTDKADGTSIAGDLITVKGGSTVSVTQTATPSVATAAGANDTITQSAVTINGNGTTSVTVAQAAEVAAANTVLAVPGVKAVQTLTFGTLTSGQDLTINGLTFTASKDLTAAQTASIFAGLESGALQGKLAAEFGSYTGTFGPGSTSAVTGTSGVIFTAATAAPLASLAATGSGLAALTSAVVTTAGVTEVLVQGKAGVAAGAVTITDSAAVDTLAAVNLDSYADSTIASDALATLNLANSTHTLAVTNALATTLALGVNNIATGSALTLGNTYKTLNITATGKDSDVTLSAAKVETLTVTGDKSVDLTAATLSALKTVNVSGSAGLTIDASGATVTAVNTAATTGKVVASIDGTKATYTGGAGVDVVTLATGTALTKAIDLGAGDDTVVFGAAVTGSTAALNGGVGTDTLSMSTANADALDAAPQTFYTGFEHLTINDAAATATIDLANLGFTNYVTTSGSAGTLTLNNLDNNGTVVLTAAATTGVTVGVKDAATGTADVLNAVLSSTGNLTAGTLTAANVETVNISTVDTEVAVAPAVQTKNVDSLTLAADKATSVNLSGASDLTLDLTGSTKVTSIDASTMTGGLTVASANITSATTIKGGLGNDVLTAAAGTTADVLIGGAGNDTLTANAGMDTLTGGAGNDLFVVGTASANVNSYATITDFSAGDSLQIAGTTSFASAQVSLGDTAVFQDYANAAMNSLGMDAAGWFQFAGNTYVVADKGADSSTFVNGQDFIVKLAGVIDLSHASLSVDNGTLAIA